MHVIEENFKKYHMEKSSVLVCDVTHKNKKKEISRMHIHATIWNPMK